MELEQCPRRTSRISRTWALPPSHPFALQWMDPFQRYRSALDGPPWTELALALAPFLACLSAPGMDHGPKLACWCPALTFQWVDGMGPPLRSRTIPPHFFHAGDARFPPCGSSLSSCSGRPSLISSNLSPPPPSFSCCRPRPSLSCRLDSSRPLFLFTPLVFVRPSCDFPVQRLARLYLPTYLTNSEEEFFCCSPVSRPVHPSRSPRNHPRIHTKGNTTHTYNKKDENQGNPGSSPVTN